MTHAGVLLSHMHTFKCCAPSRGSLMTGRLPPWCRLLCPLQPALRTVCWFAPSSLTQAPTPGRMPYHFGFYNNQDANAYGVPTNFTTVPALLRASSANYHTAMVASLSWVFLLGGLSPS